MEIDVKVHGLEWFFGDDGFSCPECNNDDWDEIDFGPVKKNQKGFNVEFRCQNCGCHGLASITNKELKERENGSE